MGKRVLAAGKTRDRGQLARMAAPAMALYLLFVIGPVLMAAGLSLFEWDGIREPRFIGLANYARALAGDPIFHRSLWQNAVYIAITLGVEVGFGLLFAAALQARLPLAGFWRALFFSPMVLSMVVVGLLWSFVFNPDFGLLNSTLRGMGLQAWERSWLGEEGTALAAVSLVSGWRYAGFYMATWRSLPRD
jgi:raffinose/stachyose/melibiose transport system permease protein